MIHRSLVTIGQSSVFQHNVCSSAARVAEMAASIQGDTRSVDNVTFPLKTRGPFGPTGEGYPATLRETHDWAPPFIPSEPVFEGGEDSGILAAQP